MIKKVVALLGLTTVCFVLTGCNAVQGYSVRSYQGPLPINDYQYLNQDGMPATVAAQ
jgi:hypothetical protein